MTNSEFDRKFAEIFREAFPGYIKQPLVSARAEEVRRAVYRLVIAKRDKEDISGPIGPLQGVINLGGSDALSLANETMKRLHVPPVTAQEKQHPYGTSTTH